MVSLRERAEYFGDALVLLAQSDDRRDRQAAAHALLADFVRPYLANSKRHNNALSRLDQVVKATSESRPELIFLHYVRELIVAHSPATLAGFVLAIRPRSVGQTILPCCRIAALRCKKSVESARLCLKIRRTDRVNSRNFH